MSGCLFNSGLCVFVCMFAWQLLEAQADYHRRSLAALESVIPTIHIQQGET